MSPSPLFKITDPLPFIYELCLFCLSFIFSHIHAHVHTDAHNTHTPYVWHIYFMYTIYIYIYICLRWRNLNKTYINGKLLLITWLVWKLLLESPNFFDTLEFKCEGNYVLVMPTKTFWFIIPKPPWGRLDQC